MTRWVSIIYAFVLGGCHILFACFFIFFGSYMNSMTSQKVFQLIGVMMLLPFSVFSSFPIFLHHEKHDILLGAMSLLFWVYVYARLINKCAK